jgi:hypothetical protein
MSRSHRLPHPLRPGFDEFSRRAVLEELEVLDKAGGQGVVLLEVFVAAGFVAVLYVGRNGVPVAPGSADLLMLPKAS